VGSIGLYQFNVVVPAVPDSDVVELTFTVEAFAGSNSYSLLLNDKHELHADRQLRATPVGKPMALALVHYVLEKAPLCARVLS
jgi:hypothetical protein